jgi:uncharacterized protein
MRLPCSRRDPPFLILAGIGYDRDRVLPMSKRIQATDLYSLTQCDRQVYLDHHGDRSLRAPQTPYQAWLSEQGRQHESQVISTLKVEKPPYTYDNLELGFQITLDLMREGVKMIYQGVLIDDDLVGIPDLLERIEGPSRLGAWYYRPLDVKSASTASEGHRLQIMAYCALLGALQGRRPNGVLLLRYPPAERSGDRLFHEEPVEFNEELFTTRLGEVRALAAGREAAPFMSSTCGGCGWREVCLPMVKKAEDASQIPGLRRDVWRALHARGLGTLTALAKVSPQDILDIKGVGDSTAPQIIARARSLSSRQAIIVKAPDLPVAEDCLVFDVETVPGEGIYYLMGTLIGERYEYDMAESLQDEGHMWWKFLRRMSSRPGPIVHYGNYERLTLSKLAERHGGTDEMDALQARMIDLEKTLKDSVVLPLSSYSLKAVAPWMGFAWTGEVEGGQDSVLEYLDWLEDGDRSHLDHILHYNEEDCRATRVVLDWLRKLPHQGD